LDFFRPFFQKIDDIRLFKGFSAGPVTLQSIYKADPEFLKQSQPPFHDMLGDSQAQEPF